jgi:hypothetical protein
MSSARRGVSIETSTAPRPGSGNQVISPSAPRPGWRAVPFASKKTMTASPSGVEVADLRLQGPALPLSLMWRRGDTNPPLAPFMQVVREEAARLTKRAVGQ